MAALSPESSESSLFNPSARDPEKASREAVSEVRSFISLRLSRILASFPLEAPPVITPCGSTVSPSIVTIVLLAPLVFHMSRATAKSFTTSVSPMRHAINPLQSSFTEISSLKNFAPEGSCGEESSYRRMSLSGTKLPLPPELDLRYSTALSPSI